MYAYLVLYLGLNPEYVMDKMEFYEIAALMNYSHQKHRVEYECARLNAYITAQCNSRKKLKPTDICEFEWEKDQNKKAIKVQQKAPDKKDVQNLLRNAREICATMDFSDAPTI